MWIYIGLLKDGDKKQLYQVLGDFEKYNLLQQINGSTTLLELFKKTPITDQTYEEILKTILRNLGITRYHKNQFELIVITRYHYEIFGIHMK